MSSLRKNAIIINGQIENGRDRKRLETVLNKLKKTARFSGNIKVVSENSFKMGKGLGFSDSGFAALGSATCEALDLNLDPVLPSETVRSGVVLQREAFLDVPLSDMRTDKKLPQSMRNNPVLCGNCTDGALPEQEYLEAIEDGGAEREDCWKRKVY